MASARRNISGIFMRRMALSSRVRSIHWSLSVLAKLVGLAMSSRESEYMRSERMGLRLYAMAELPICSFSNGSSISFQLAR